MNHKLRLIVCLTDDSDAYNELVADIMTEFGGLTIFDAKGGWVDPTGEYIWDICKIIDIYFSSETPAKQIMTGLSYLQAYGEKTGQNSLAAEINGVLWLWDTIDNRIYVDDATGYSPRMYDVSED